ncbi:MAG: DNA-directed RNA polymerase subunit beta' [Candidatus Brennerbacteria bacterium]|nr:DNA-directed RNA polymerase subunit beta' [Candidatus Brennerbacteria bacterium]
MDNLNFSSIKLKIASPDDIYSWSRGEVTKPETINYRTQRPEKDGLFSERIFGPTKDWECYCGKYKKIRYKGVVCDKCGVEVTRSVVRRERMGHISLAAPVTHLWFLKSVISRTSLALDIPLPKIEKVAYYVAYIVTSVNEEAKRKTLTALAQEFKSREKEIKAIQKEDQAKAKEKTGKKIKPKKQSKKDKANGELLAGWEKAKTDIESLVVGSVMIETEYHNISRRFGDVFEADTGAGALRKIMESMDLKKTVKEIEAELAHVKDAGRERRLLKRLKFFRSMMKSGIRPEWLIMTVLPVLPPDLRPMVALDGGRYATSDLNDLYRRVINRNNRLKKLIELKAPEIIVTNEKRMLQEAVDALIDNTSKSGSQQLSTQRRPLRSLADMLKGKQGRFRQNLLGKRVDYSARSVIVVGPELKLNECGLPKKMALELFRPFVINKLIEGGLAYNIKNANRLIDQASSEVWAVLEEVIKNRFVLLNRAPTLHRLGIHAFKPVLIEDLAIRIPPMVCAAFNADFDGDQMAVHLPLTEEAQLEAGTNMVSSGNLLKPANGEPIIIPTQDIVLGTYYLTKFGRPEKEPRILGGIKEAMFAYETGIIKINTPIKVPNPKLTGEIIITSYGRLIFNEALPADFEFSNDCFTKKKLSQMVAMMIDRYGFKTTVDHLDKIRALGFKYATQSGFTWSMADLVIPKEKKEIFSRAEKDEALIKDQYNNGLLTNNERRAKIIGVWTRVRSEIEKVVPKSLDPEGSIYSIIDSGARGSWVQPIQMTGMKGLVQDPKGETIELPVKASLKEGVSVLEYFISTHGARKGSTDTALKTASAGYLTRRLVDISQDVILREKDCRTREGIEIARKDGESYGYHFGQRIFSRMPLEDVKVGNKILARAGEVIDRKIAAAINDSKIESIKVRSPLACKTLYGVCSVCYGYDLGYNQPINIGEAVGIVAAQSIGEPGTQLTMRTFHQGGVAGLDITHGLPRVEEVFEVRPPKGKAVLSEIDGMVEEIADKILFKTVKIKNSGPKAKKEKAVEYSIPRSLNILVKDGEKVFKGTPLCEGHIDLKELMSFKGARETERYIINEIQKIYVPEGATINDKHIEVIVRQMFSKIAIKEPGDTDFVVGEVVDKSLFFEINRQMKKLKKQPARAQQLLLGVTRASLAAESFLSAASFQETSRVLVAAASEGKIDKLRGLKENVIIGRLIPVGKKFPGNNKDESVAEAVYKEADPVKSAEPVVD